jgi:hypothetical protein
MRARCFPWWKAIDPAAPALWPKIFPYGGTIVNAAFLLVTTAWLAGADAPPPAKPVPPPAADCCGAGNACDECPGFFERLRGRFHHNECCEQNQCCQPAPKCETCNEGCRQSWRERFGGLFHRNECGCCEAAPKCESQPACNECCGSGWGERLRGLFHRHGCDECGNDCCGGNGAAPPGRAPESIPAPKAPPQKMPEAPSKTAQNLAPQAPANGSLIIDQ